MRIVRKLFFIVIILYMFSPIRIGSSGNKALISPFITFMNIAVVIGILGLIITITLRILLFLRVIPEKYIEVTKKYTGGEYFLPMRLAKTIEFIKEKKK